ncbi:zinc ribbon domain-containing protein [Candidatus Methanodesulfokora washburnensis]|uniref:Zinc ribbon domain-containing protein n=1 Tax=Candidatus Methanodesulfokora washburnensis TaxID=2478471 RepID=A0A3R9QGJ6_9CREN|nr:zinc ribbon domain-containing protein [Candidatus Methanodesulfokores washburnensis]RSN75998.1 zinc ribbon domain-containing protein [Candidatus Methanodesulfokores washburnensis]
MRRGLVALGVLLVILGILIPEIPISGGYSIREIDNLCKSAFGVLGRLLSPAAQRECGKAAAVVLFSEILIIIGVVAVVVGLLKGAKSSPKEEISSAQTATVGRYCKFCGAYIGDAKFCPKCGRAQE